MVSVNPREEIVELRSRDTNASLLKGIFKVGLGQFIVVVPIHTLEKRPKLVFGMSYKGGEICKSQWLVGRPAGHSIRQDKFTSIRYLAISGLVNGFNHIMQNMISILQCYKVISADVKGNRVHSR